MVWYGGSQKSRAGAEAAGGGTGGVDDGSTRGESGEHGHIEGPPALTAGGRGPLPAPV